MKTLVLLLLTLMLSACGAGSSKQLATTHQRIEAACVSAGTAYGVIAVINSVHPLTAVQQTRVLAAKHIVDSRCILTPSGDYPSTMSEVLLGELEQASSTLTEIQGVLK